METQSFTDSMFSKYAEEIRLKKNFPEKEKFNKIEGIQSKNDFLITLGGPFQTMLTGTLGIFLMLQQRRKIRGNNTIYGYQWFCIFLSMFWLRQLANAITWIIGFFINGQFSLNGDEIKAALFLNLPKGLIVFSTAVIAFSILLFIIFRIVPSFKRITFILAGLIGGIMGYLFWLVWFGPIIMP